MVDQFSLQSDIKAVIAGLTQLSNEIPGIEKAALLIAKSLRAGGSVFFCGNGGSAADSQHRAAELTGRFNFNRPSYKAIALTVDTSALTAIGNDFGFDQIFSRQLQGLACEGDVLIGITTSGNSKNVVEAAREMKKIGGYVIGFSGPNEANIDDYADILIRAVANRTDLIQNIQVVIGHSLCKAIEQLLVDFASS
jgi:D-sedoheptulose 7-phosphate isomerase